MFNSNIQTQNWNEIVIKVEVVFKFEMCQFTTVSDCKSVLGVELHA